MTLGVLCDLCTFLYVVNRSCPGVGVVRFLTRRDVFRRLHNEEKEQLHSQALGAPHKIKVILQT
jgi:hypothetical protein